MYGEWSMSIICTLKFGKLLLITKMNERKDVRHRKGINHERYLLARGPREVAETEYFDRSEFQSFFSSDAFSSTSAVTFYLIKRAKKLSVPKLFLQAFKELEQFSEQFSILLIVACQLSPILSLPPILKCELQRGMKFSLGHSKKMCY